MVPDVTLRLIAGRYRLLHLLGQGGMGQVWAARDELLGRDVAVKEMMPPRGISNADLDVLCERAMREARAIARVTHPNVVRVIDVVPDDGLPCIVMELVASRSLYEVIREEGPMVPDRVAGIGLDILAALRAAHRERVVHRDVKPANVLLTDDGRTILTDFGLVSIVGDASMTDTGIVLGSPNYLAPELALDGKAGPASDLWSLGATLYMAVEGSPPYSKSTPAATLAAVATELPQRPKRAGVLTDVLEGLLRRDPDQRIDAGTTERLLRVAAGLDQPSPAHRTFADETRPPRRRGRMFLLAGAVVALLAAGALIRPVLTPGHGHDTAAALDRPTTSASPVLGPGQPSLSPAKPASGRPSPTITPRRSTPARATAVAPGGSTVVPTSQAARDFTVAYYAARINGRYVTADDGGDSPLIAFPQALGPWETWDEVDLGNGDIALRSEFNTKYVTADSAGVQPLIASKTTVGKAETFRLVHNADGSVSFLARANGKYVTAPGGGNEPLINNQSAIGDAEKFDRIPG